MTPPMPSTSLQPIPRDKRNAAEHLRSHVESMIAAGRFAPGDRLPPIRTLAEQFSLPPSTARRVIRELCDKGLLTLRHGSGTYVRDRGEKNTEARIVTPESALDSWGEYLYVFCKDGKWRYYALCDDQPELRDVETDLAKEFEAMGIERPKDEYGFFPQERIDQLKKEQAQMRKSDAVM